MATKDITDIQVCEAVRDAFGNAGRHIASAHTLLTERTGQPPKVCWKAIERACRRDLIDYGVGLKFPWLTDNGKQLLCQVTEA